MIDINIKYEIMKYLLMFMIISIVLLVLYKTKYGRNLKWYYGLIIGGAIGFFYPILFRWLFGW